MTTKEFIDIMGCIDKRLIESTLDLETPYEELLTNDRPQKVYVSRKKNGALLFSVCAAACLAVVVGVTLILNKVNKTPVTPPFDVSDSSDAISASSDASSDISSENSSDSSSDQSGGSGTSAESDPITSTAISDPGDTGELYIDREDLRDPTVISSTSGLECKTLFYLRAPGEYGSPSIRNIFVNRDGIFVLASDGQIGNDYLFDLDKDGNGYRHFKYDGSIYGYSKDLSVNDNSLFTTTHNFNEFGFYDAKTREMLSDLPSCYRADLLLDEKKYLYIDPERRDLVLYNIETKNNTASIAAVDFILGTDWVIDSVNAVSPELATVRLMKYDPDNASGYTGNEDFRTYLLELSTLKVIQQLSDDAEVMALDEGNFLVAERVQIEHRNGRRVYRAKLENGNLVKTGEYYVNCEYGANVLLSPNKKIAVIRENTGAYNMRCTAVYADTLERIWSIEFSDEYITGFTMSAAVTDDAVLYLTDGIEGRIPVYRIGLSDIQ